ncbi:MAG: hypothetical protein IT342_02260 [Candidatus Melainabacteria bacterium]|nr:hypothetical protein [Candidatus Melainabacteria bacterium]
MVKLPARLLAVFALAGLVLGIVGLSKIGSTPAQDVAPPGGSSPPSAGGVPDGIPGASSDGSSGSGSWSSSSGPDQPVSSVVNSTEPAFEWTLERMLLATPMPITRQERDFLFKHPALEKIKDWTQEQFNSYVSSDLGTRQAAQEGVRWRELVVMLKKQQSAAASFLKKKPGKKDPILPQSGASHLDTADWEQFQKSMQNDPRTAFAKMKEWRQAIAVLASSVESMRKEAEKKGLADRFNDAISASD